MLKDKLKEMTIQAVKQNEDFLEDEYDRVVKEMEKVARLGRGNIDINIAHLYVIKKLVSEGVNVKRTEEFGVYTLTWLKWI